MARQIRPRPVRPLHGPAPANFRRSSGRMLLVSLALLILPELVLVPADHGLWGSASWRPTAYQDGAFWTGLLRDWRPNYALQPGIMFVTYAFLHAGPSHLLGNLLALVPLGQTMSHWLGPGRTLVVGIASALGGALAFGLLSRDPSPMVGASGVVFGLAGALAIREGLNGKGAGLRRALAFALGLALVNFAMWALTERVAWQTHAGGALAGAGAAWLLRPRKVGSICAHPPQRAGPETSGEASAPDSPPPATLNTLS